MIGMDGEKRGIHELGSKLGVSHVAGGAVEAADVNSLTAAVSHAVGQTLTDELEAGISAEVHEVVIALSRGDAATENGHHENKSKTQKTAAEPHDFPLLNRPAHSSDTTPCTLSVYTLNEPEQTGDTPAYLLLFPCPFLPACRWSHPREKRQYY